MNPIVDFMKTMLNHSANPARTSAIEAKTSAENIKQHFQKLQGQDMDAHNIYVDKHQKPRQDREDIYAQYLATKAALMQEWRSTKSKSVLHQYLTLNPPLNTKPEMEIYTKFL